MLVPQTALDEVEQWTLMATTKRGFTAGMMLNYTQTTNTAFLRTSLAQLMYWLLFFLGHHTAQLIFEL